MKLHTTSPAAALSTREVRILAQVADTPDIQASAIPCEGHIQEDADSILYLVANQLLEASGPISFCNYRPSLRITPLGRHMVSLHRQQQRKERMQSFVSSLISITSALLRSIDFSEILAVLRNFFRS